MKEWSEGVLEYFGVSSLLDCNVLMDNAYNSSI